MCMKYGFSPAPSTHFLKVNSWSLGEHEATTTLLTPFSFIDFLISSWPRSEQAYLRSLETTTPGSFEMASATFSQFTTPPMLVPQWQTKTPIACFSATLLSTVLSV